MGTAFSADGGAVWIQNGLQLKGCTVTTSVLLSASSYLHQPCRSHDLGFICVRHPCPLDRRTGGPHSLVGRGG